MTKLPRPITKADHEVAAKLDIIEIKVPAMLVLKNRDLYIKNYSNISKAYDLNTFNNFTNSHGFSLENCVIKDNGSFVMASSNALPSKQTPK